MTFAMEHIGCAPFPNEYYRRHNNGLPTWIVWRLLLDLPDTLRTHDYMAGYIHGLHRSQAISIDQHGELLDRIGSYCRWRKERP